ncbi:hypothetical protein E1181_20735 [Saccharopolyspora terrae]|uniref:Uncharacterized protein n=1 Tax=Saccharopolyspora terrae TaxID=2530384 RepID=A0A4R4VSV8_9PSEU|nr:hypothetical protein [Saccharopolyspora terrae]TDD03320.1 hypothetical protein E1181_20735 [Saccharopolyspora terrae]
MTELIEAMTSWRSLGLALIVFGFAPGFVLRLLVLVYPKDDPRRTELVAQLYELSRLERLLFVAEQLETVLFEGFPHRVRSVLRSRDRVRTQVKRRIPDPGLPVAYRTVAELFGPDETLRRFSVMFGLRGRAVDDPANHYLVTTLTSAFIQEKSVEGRFRRWHARRTARRLLIEGIRPETRPDVRP